MAMEHGFVYIIMVTEQGLVYICMAKESML